MYLQLSGLWYYLNESKMRYKLKRSQQLYQDIESVWDFFTSPDNLLRITPKDMNFRILYEIPDKEIYEGMIINYTVAPFLGIPLNWQTEITQVNYLKSFTDFQQKGPYKLWNHYHEFIPNNEGVLMVDTVEYELPFGVIGEMVHKLVVKKKLDQIFNYRYQVLEQLLNQGKS